MHEKVSIRFVKREKLNFSTGLGFLLVKMYHINSTANVKVKVKPEYIRGASW